jgi:hypothetical protein
MPSAGSWRISGAKKGAFRGGRRAALSLFLGTWVPFPKTTKSLWESEKVLWGEGPEDHEGAHTDEQEAGAQLHVFCGEITAQNPAQESAD